MKSCKKAQLFCAQKWDLAKGTPIESGTTIDDIVERARRKTHQLKMKEKGTYEESVTLSDNDDVPSINKRDVHASVGGDASAQNT